MTESDIGKGIFWLASYPKSGNTWARAFLAALTSENDEQLDINQLATGSIGSSREWIQDALGIEIGELSHTEIDQLRPKAYQWIADQITDNSETGFHKVHDAYSYLGNGEPLIPVSASKGVVYLVRNPMDVAVSLANHSNISTETAVSQVCDSDMAFCQSSHRLPSQLRQILMSWGEHVESWLSADIPRLVCRYEDMHENPVATFTEMTDFLDISTTRADIDTAIKESHFENLRRQEDEQGFGEKIPGVKNFFRKGVVGDWRKQLSEEQVARIVKVNGQVMKKLGYLDDQGNITVSATR